MVDLLLTFKTSSGNIYMFCFANFITRHFFTHGKFIISEADISYLSKYYKPSTHCVQISDICIITLCMLIIMSVGALGVCLYVCLSVVLFVYL